MTKNLRLILVSLILIGLGIGISLMVFSSRVASTWPKDENAATVSVTNLDTGEPIREPLHYTVSLYIFPNTSHIGIFIEVSNHIESRLSRLKYSIYWPGTVSEHERPGQGDLLVTIGKKLSCKNIQNVIAERSNIAQYYPDRIKFVWRDAIENLSFSEKRIRLLISELSSSIKVNLYSTCKVVSEFPVHKTHDFSATSSTVCYEYDSREVIVIFEDPSAKSLGQYVLLFGGILIGLGINCITALITSVGTVKKKHNHLINS